MADSLVMDEQTIVFLTSAIVGALRKSNLILLNNSSPSGRMPFFHRQAVNELESNASRP
jgi:hypothetical protein